MQSQPRVNLGCGDHYARGWLNVDLSANSDVRPDLEHDITKPLPLPKLSVEQLYAGHVLEHLPKSAVVPALTTWRNYIAPITGQLVVVGPCCDRAATLREQGAVTKAELWDIRNGGHRWPGDEHRWRSSESATAIMLNEAGYRVTRWDIASRQLDRWPVVSRVAWQFALKAVPV